MLGAVPVSAGKPDDFEIIEEPYLWYLLFHRNRKRRQGDVPLEDIDHKVGKDPDAKDSNAVNYA